MGGWDGGYKEQDLGWRGQRVCGKGLCVCVCVLCELLEADMVLSVEREDVISLLQ